MIIFKTKFFFVLLFIVLQNVNFQFTFGKDDAKNSSRRRQISSDFSPFELLNVTTRWTYGRTYGGKDDLSKYVTENGEAYWTKLNFVFDNYVQQKSDTMKKQWAETVAKDNLVESGKVSQKCFDVLYYMISQPMETEWSAKMIDSMGSLPVGLLSSTITELGDFDQCLSVDGTFESFSFVGKYCLATVNIPRAAYQPVTFNASVLNSKKLKNNFNWKIDAVELWHQLDNKYPISSAVCFPSICREEEVKEVIKSYYQILQLFEFNVTYCQSRDKPWNYNSKIWIAVIILAIPTSLAILSLIVNLIFDPPETVKKPYSFHRFLYCFSPIANTKALVRIQSPENTINSQNNEKTQFYFLHGFRAFASILVLLAHVNALMIGSVVVVQPYARYATDFRSNVRTFAYQPIFNSGLIVNTFFLISGALVAYKGFSRNELKVSYLSFLFLRWARFTPLLLGTLCLTVALELFGSGPLFHHDHLMVNLGACYDYWWTHLTYIVNLVPLDCNCIISSWYLAAEMQIHLVAYLLLIIYKKFGSRATYFTSSFFILFQLVAVSSSMLSGWARQTFFQLYPFTLDIFPEYIYNLRIMYMPTYHHFVPYFTGAIVGQMLLEKVVIQFSSRVTRFLWTVSAFVTIFLFTYSYFPMQVPDEELETFLPGSFSVAMLLFTESLAWSAICGWAFYQCALNPRENALARFLSAPVFQPLSRLSFSLCLGHIMILWFNDLQTRTTVSLSFNGLVQLFSSTLVQSLVIAYYLYLTWEAPFGNLLKIFINFFFLEEQKSKNSILEDKSPFEKQGKQNNESEQVKICKKKFR